MFASLKEKYFLSDKGIAGVKRGIFWTSITNLAIMGGMAFLFFAMDGFTAHLIGGDTLPDAMPFCAGLAVFLVLLFASNWQQYNNTYCVFYEECGNQRIRIAERLRRLPLSFFGRRDLADLTETILGDVQTMEHAYSHVLGELWVPSSRAPSSSWALSSFAGSCRSPRFGVFRLLSRSFSPRAAPWLPSSIECAHRRWV